MKKFRSFNNMLEINHQIVNFQIRVDKPSINHRTQLSLAQKGFLFHYSKRIRQRQFISCMHFVYITGPQSLLLFYHSCYAGKILLQTNRFNHRRFNLKNEEVSLQLRRIFKYLRSVSNFKPENRSGRDPGLSTL